MGLAKHRTGPDCIASYLATCPRSWLWIIRMITKCIKRVNTIPTMIMVYAVTVYFCSQPSTTTHVFLEWFWTKRKNNTRENRISLMIKSKYKPQTLIWCWCPQQSVGCGERRGAVQFPPQTHREECWLLWRRQVSPHWQQREDSQDIWPGENWCRYVLDLTSVAILPPFCDIDNNKANLNSGLLVTHFKMSCLTFFGHFPPWLFLLLLLTTLALFYRCSTSK